MTRAPKVSKIKKIPICPSQISLSLPVTLPTGQVQGIFCILTRVGQLTQTVFVKKSPFLVCWCKMKILKIL